MNIIIKVILFLLFMIGIISQKKFNSFKLNKHFHNNNANKSSHNNFVSKKYLRHTFVLKK